MRRLLHRSRHASFAVATAALTLLTIGALSAGCESDTDQITLFSPPGELRPPRALADADDWEEPVVLPLARSAGYVLVTGYINGLLAGPMMIDTGASLSVVTLGVAGRLELSTDGTGQTVGVGGIERFNYYRVERFTLHAPGPASAAVTLDTQRLAGLELSEFGRALGVGLAGIVGFTDLAAVPFCIDAAAQELTLYPPSDFRPPRDAVQQRLQLMRRLPVVEVEFDDGRQRVRVPMLIDYGADTALTLPTQLLERYPGLVAVDAGGSGATRGVGGTVRSTQTWIRQVHLLGLSLQHVPVNFETPPAALNFAAPGQPPQAVGRIGNALLQHFALTFDTSRGYIYAKWQPDAGTP